VIVMRVPFLFLALSLGLFLGAASLAVPPDPEFTAQADAYIEAKKLEFLDRIEASGRVPSAEDEAAAECRAMMWWKMAHPDGEQKLTLEALIAFRQAEILCGQRMRRATVLPTERQTPPATRADPTTGTGTNDLNDNVDDNDGTRQAHEDYMRWHPEEYEDATNERDYIDERLEWWWILGPGRDLHAAIENPVGITGPGAELSEEERAFNAAEAAEAERLRAEWRAANPNAPSAPPPATPDGPPDGYFVGDYRGDLIALPPPGYMRDPYRGNLVRDPDFGSVDPLDVERWRQARQPVVVGANDEVGSGARRRERATGAAGGMLRGALGLGGSSRRSRDDGPDVVRCRFNRREVSQFENANADTRVSMAGQRGRNGVQLFAEIERSADSGTFQAAVLQNQHGQLLEPSNVRICDLYGEGGLTVSWSNTSYRNGRQVSHESGGWSNPEFFSIPGLGSEGADQPGGMWRQLGFDNASHGARHVELSFDISAEQIRRDGAVLLLHLTRPGDDPVVTTPFVLMLEETSNGLEMGAIP
jgi:hypothetical protein